MNQEETFQKLTQLFASKINYDGEFNSLFFIEREKHTDKLKINFLNKQHYDFIIEHLINDILDIVDDEVILGRINLKTNPITLKNAVKLDEETEQVVVPKKVRPKERVELPTIKNKTIKQIEDFMLAEYDKIMEDQKKIREEHDDYMEVKMYYSNYGQVQFIAHLYDWMKKIKDYEED
jgi:hypothetical protein